MQETRFNRLQIYVKKRTFSRLSQKMFSKVDCGVVCPAVSRLLGKVAIGIPQQVVELVGKAVVVPSHCMGLIARRIGVGVCRSSIVLQFAAQPPCGGVYSDCYMT